MVLNYLKWVGRLSLSDLQWQFEIRLSPPFVVVFVVLLVFNWLLWIVKIFHFIKINDSQFIKEMAFQENSRRNWWKCCCILANRQPVLKSLLGQIFLMTLSIDNSPTKKQFHLFLYAKIFICSKIQCLIY